MAQSARLLDYEESYILSGLQKTKIYTELNTDLKVDDRVYIVGGNFDNYTLGIGAVPADPYAEYAMGYRILAIDVDQNWLVIDRDYDGTSVLASPTDEAFLSRGHFRKGQFNAGSFNDGIFGNNVTPSEALFNHKQDLIGNYIPDAYVNHCIWLNGVWHEGEWLSKTDKFKNFTSTKATLNPTSGLITIDTLTGADLNNTGYGYNLWVDGTWENGHWFNGTWEAGTWEDGEWDKGIFKSGDWLDGVKHKGIHTSINGRTNWLGGTHENGTMNDCFWEDGTWEDGTWGGANKFNITGIKLPVTAPYSTSGLHFAVTISNNDYLPIFQAGDEVLLSYVKANGDYDNVWNMQPFVVQDITINNEIILLGTVPASTDLTLARISNSRFRHGTWENGTWKSGYRRAGVEIDTSTIDDSVAGQLTVEIIDPISWTGSAVSVDYGLVIGETVTLTNITDSLGNESENYPLTITGIVPGSPTTVGLSGAPLTWQLDTSVKETAEGSYVDNTIWEDGKFLSGTWENGYLKTGDFFAERESTTNSLFTHWRQGQWSLEIWTGTLDLHANWYNGIWEKGLFKHGEWHDGIWENGTWDSFYVYTPIVGDSYSVHWRNGTWKNGTWNLGEWDNGTWENGQWNDGLLNNTDLGLQFWFPGYEIIDGTQQLRFRFDGLFPFSVEPVIGDSIVINNTTDLFLTPTPLFDSNAAPVTGTTYEIINFTQDIGNSWTYITVDSPQNYGFFPSSYYLGDVTITPVSKNLFHDGSFLGGQWDNGVFNNGVFDGAVPGWMNGIFNNGLFNNSTWTDGKFNDGTIQNSIWNDGQFYGGTFLTGDWNNGEMYGGEIQSSTWNAGQFYDGLMTFSTINSGDFYGGEANNSTMNGGNLRDGHLFKDSIMNGGTLDGAIFESSTKNAGHVADGIIKGDSFNYGGTFGGGDWNEGTWVDGSWTTPIFEANGFSYDIPGFGGTTVVSLYETDENNLITNGEFMAPAAEWTPDPEWSLGGGLASAILLSGVGAGTYNTYLKQLAVPNLFAGKTYRVSFDIVENTHPYTGILFGAKNLLYVEIGTAVVGLPDTTVGSKTVIVDVVAPGGALDFNIRAQIYKVPLTEQRVRIDNVVVDEILSSTAGFSIGDEVWTSGISYKFTPPEDLAILSQKGIVSSVANGVLKIDFIGDLIIEKTNPTQKRLYASKGIWRNGSLIEGAMTGMIFKQGTLTKPNMLNSVVENGTALHEVTTVLGNPGLDLTTTVGWTGSPRWDVISGSAKCAPDVTTPLDITQTGILTNTDWYMVTLTVSSNSNYLEEYVSILLGTNEYFLGAGEINKTYKILGQAAGTDFTMRVVSKLLSLSAASVKVTNLKIEKINITEMTSSTWLNGTAEGVYFDDSQWVDGTAQSVIFKDSTWEEGTCEYADFLDCNWKAGVWNDGVWNATDAFEAKWENGAWNGGMFYNGEFLCGAWSGGIWNKGMFRDGSLDGLTKFYGGAIQYGSVTLRRYPSKSFIIINIGNDNDGDTIQIKSNTGDTYINITARDLLGTPGYKYPSGIFNPTDWSTNEPGWTTNFRPAADWGLDEQKIIMRDVFDYHLNNDGSYSDLWDVDFVDSNDTYTNDLSGDGMETSPNTQTALFIEFTKKLYEEISIQKAGSSVGFSSAGDSKAGLNRVQWLGGAYLGDSTTTKIAPPTDFMTTVNNGGFAELRFAQDFTGQITGGDKIYMYGTGDFDNDVSNLFNKDGYYNVTSAAWNGGGSYFYVITDTPVIGAAPVFTLNEPVELWVDVIDTAPSVTDTGNFIGKVGRYFTYYLNGDHTAVLKKNLDVKFSGITNLTTLNYIKNDKIYKVKTVSSVFIPRFGTQTLITLDIKLGSLITTAVLDPSVTVQTYELAPDIDNLCLGGTGPGPAPPGPGPGPGPTP